MFLRSISLSALALASCSTATTEDRAPRPNILLITLDTLRADHLSCYGYPMPTSPRIDAFAAAATRYAQCFATSSWTVPSHASLFTGRHPFEHGAYSYDVDVLQRNVYPLDDDHLTLAEVLAQEGYATGGVVCNTTYLDPYFRLNQGFETWDVERERAEGVNARALRWIDGWIDEHGSGVEGGKPFFLFLNYLDTHRPYNTTPKAGEALFRKKSKDLLNAMIERVLVEGQPAGDLADELIPQYDRAVRNVDAALGELFDALVERGLWDDTVVVLTSDHGEYFGEHELVEHSKDIYVEGLAVPLVVKRPYQTEGEVIATPASLVDVPRLILANLGRELEERLAARFRYVPGNHPILAELHYSRSKDLLSPDYGQRFRRVRTALYDGGYKYIQSSDGADELYRLADDPGETRNLIDAEPALAAELAAKLAAIQSRDRWDPGPPPRVAIDPGQLSEMQALGYAGEEDYDGDADAGGERREQRNR